MPRREADCARLREKLVYRVPVNICLSPSPFDTVPPLQGNGTDTVPLTVPLTPFPPFSTVPPRSLSSPALESPHFKRSFWLPFAVILVSVHNHGAVILSPHFRAKDPFHLFVGSRARQRRGAKRRLIAAHWGKTKCKGSFALNCGLRMTGRLVGDAN